MGELCLACNGRGYVRTRHADEECESCEGFGMVYGDETEGEDE